jgi:hypothetical protein
MNNMITFYYNIFKTQGKLFNVFMLLVYYFIVLDVFLPFLFCIFLFSFLFFGI